MKISSVNLLLTTLPMLVVVVSSVSALHPRPSVDWVTKEGLDTNRAPAFFDQPKARKGGYTYSDEFSMVIEGTMNSGGMNLKGSMDAAIDMSTTVENTASHGKKLTMTIDNVLADVRSFIMNLHCDSNDRSKSAKECVDIFAMVGESETVETNENGEVTMIKTFDGQTLDMSMMTEQVNGMSLNEKFQANQLAASMHYDKASQMLKLIPDHAVRPGDSWIDDVEMGSMGTFKGNSYLQGYADYEGSDCAVFYFQGHLHLDISNIAQAVGADVGDLPQKEADAEITNVIFWDVNDKINRWAEVNITTSFDVQNPMDPSDPTPVHIPVELSVILATDIDVRPDQDDEQDRDDYGVEEYVSTSTRTSSSNYSSSGSTGGAFRSIFTLVLVGAVGISAFLVYKKRQEGWEFHNTADRRSYTVTSMSDDPMIPHIHHSSPMI